jgi:hypothetical protein
MKRLLRWISIVLGSLAGLGIIAYAALYILSERVLRRTYAIPAVTLSIPSDSRVDHRRAAACHCPRLLFWLPWQGGRGGGHVR